MNFIETFISEIYETNIFRPDFKSFAVIVCKGLVGNFFVVVVDCTIVHISKNV